MRRPLLLVCLVATLGCSSSGDSTSPAAAGDDGGGGGGPPAAEGGAPTPDGSSPAGPDATAPDAASNDDAPYKAQRQACTFKQGAKPSDTFGPSIANLSIPIDTIVIVSQENRSFDEYFSQLPAAGQLDVDVPPAGVTLVDSSGASHAPFHQTDYCSGDTNHDWDSMHADWDSAKNDGFVKVNDPNGARTLGWFDQTDLTFYYGLATTYGVGDAYFSGVLGPTGPNRLYLYAGTSYGHIKDGPGVPSSQPDIFQELTKASVPFEVYTASTQPLVICPGFYSFETSMFCGSIPKGAQPMSDYLAAAKAGTLPPVSWIYPGADEHPPADMQIGESKVQAVFDALAASPQWAHAAFIVVYDEDGGAYDHTPPPAACKPDAIAPNIPAEGSTKADFDHYGFRVPILVASPYSKPHHVSHVVYSHTSLLRFLELRFGLPALSDRDANEEPLLDFFDFGSPPAFATPVVPSPVTVATPSTKGC